MINAEQMKLIKYLCNVGHGYGCFTASVEQQGWVSPKQHKTMLRMKSEIEFNRARLMRWRRENKQKYPYDDLGSIGCSDSEAMSFGEYF